MSEDMLTQISDLIMGDPDFRELSQSQDVYCPFEALGVAKYEIRHSNFLANLVTPNAAHGFGDLFLKSFLDALLAETDATALRLALHLESLESAEVLREWRHIDILIRLPRVDKEKGDLVFAVELKIEARESEGQLEKYEKSVRQTWPDAEPYFFFLTPNLTESSREAWIDVSLSSVLGKFEDALREGEGQAEARRMTEAYIAMMRRRYVEDEELLDLVSGIWARHRSALEYLAEYQPNVVNDLQQALIDSDYLDQIAQNARKENCSLTLDQDASSSRAIRHAVKEWDIAKGMRSEDDQAGSPPLLRLVVDFQRKGVHVRWVVGPGSQEDRLGYINALDPNRSKQPKSEWTFLHSKRLLTRQQVDAIIDDGLKDETKERFIQEIVRYATKTGVQFDLALREAKILM